MNKIWFLKARAHKVRDIIKGVDIGAEYGLVKQKKSQLSAAQRREVVRRYEQSTDAKDGIPEGDG